MKSVLAFVFLFSSLSLFAQQQQPVLASAQIVVTASSVPESVETTPAAVSVITKSDIEKREARDVSDVLREVPGVTFARTGSPGKATSLFLRGASSKQALVLWNGVAMNNAYLSGYDFGQLSSAGVQKVEVIRGPYSALYGSEAVGGVVNVLTGPEHSEFSATVEGGQRGLRNGTVDGAIVNGLWTAYGAAERRDDDGFAANDDFTSDTFVGGVQFVPNANFSLAATARHVTYDLGIPRNVNGDFTAFVASPNRRQHGSETQIVVPVRFNTSSLHYDLRLGDNERVEHFRDPDAPFGGEFGDTIVKTRSARAAAQSSQTAAGIVTFGGEFARSDVDHTDSFGLDVRSQSRDSRSLFAEDRVSVPMFSTKLEIAAGARYDRFDTFGSQISPRLALAFVENNRKWRAAYGRGFRAPAIGELYAPFFGNADLNAEHSRNVEAGFDQYVRNGMLSLTWFRSTYDDLIAFEAGTSRFANIERANAQGIEAAASRRFGPLTASLSYTWQKAIDASTREQLIRRPRHSGSLAVAFDRGALSSELSVIYAGVRRDVTDLVPFGIVTNDAHTTADLVMKYQLGSIAPFVKVENATDARYEEVFGYPSARRRLIAGVRYKL